MTHNQTIAQLQELRLQGMAQALQRQLEQPASTELGFEQRLALLVQHEIDSRHDRRSARLLKQASLKYAQAHIEDFDARASRGLERARWMALALSDWATSGATIILSGATGCGKTWLACALGQYACRQGHSTRYLRLPRLGEELGLVRATGTYTRWLGKLAKTQVLILDDWGLVALDNGENQEFGTDTVRIPMIVTDVEWSETLPARQIVRLPDPGGLPAPPSTSGRASALVGG